MLTTIAYIVFFIAFGINCFWPFRHANVIMGIAALIVGILALIGLR